MAVDRRRANVNWQLTDEQGKLYTTPGGICHLAVLMDIRDELQNLNALLHCGNFQGFPATLQTIAANTTKRKYVRKAKP